MAIIKIKSSKQEQNATDTVAKTMQEQAAAAAPAPKSAGRVPRSVLRLVMS